MNTKHKGLLPIAITAVLKQHSKETYNVSLCYIIRSPDIAKPYWYTRRVAHERIPYDASISDRIIALYSKYKVPFLHNVKRNDLVTRAQLNAIAVYQSFHSASPSLLNITHKDIK